MQKIKVIIIGAGGHGKVVADALLKQGLYDLAGFADDNKQIGEKIFLDFQVVCSTAESEIKKQAAGFILAIGNNKIRKDKFALLRQSLIPITVIHPFASVSPDVEIGDGTVVLAGAIINSSVRIGENCIINSLALIDHDCVIGNDCHVGQASIVGSGNNLDTGFHLAQGENIISKFY